jgi:hypothetical protein
MNYELKIFDTSDSYIIAFIGNGLNAEYIVPTYKELYDEIDVSVSIVNTPYTIYSEDTKEFIKQTCGSVIPTSLPFCGNSSRFLKDGDNIVAKLVKDIKLVIDFNGVRRFWKAYSTTAEETPITDAKVPIDEMGALKYSSIESFIDDHSKSSPYISSPTAQVETLSEPSMLPDAYNTMILPSNHVKKSSRGIEKVAYILWNITYSIAIIYEDFYNVIPNIERDFGEWTVIEKMGSNDVNLIVSSKYVFHKKTFESIDILKDKVNCFKKLVDLVDKEVPTHPTASTSGPSLTSKQIEPCVNKDKLMEFINCRFIRSEDKNKRVRATDLYKMVCNEFCINFSYESFLKRKLIGHLLELSVTKKRFSDGYYFCGISIREKT